MPTDLTIRPMTRTEVDLLVEWAAREGWNPGLHDAEIFWATDPQAFLAAERDGELVGGGAITSYGGDYGFMGFFIVRPEHRGVGLGNALWHARRDALIARLKPGASIGMDGVFTMQPYYAQGGFVFSHRDLRFAGRVAQRPEADGPGRDDRSSERPRPPGAHEIVAASAVPLDELLAYDRRCFPAPRRGFVEAWIGQPDARALALRRGTALAGYGVIRRCRDGCKVGPLFADDTDAAQALLDALSPFAAGGMLYLDTPENNPAAVALARRAGMTEVFGCARMVLGPVPDLAHDRIFGVTTFELG